MKTSWKAKLAKKLGMVVVASSLSLGMACGASGDDITVPDASFEDHNIVAHGGPADYTYSSDTNYGDGYSPGAGGDSAWTSRTVLSNDNGGWMYNTAYALANDGFPSGPRTGTQSISPSHGYIHQVLDDVFEPDSTYRFSIYSANVPGDSSFKMYIYDGTETLDGGDDDDNLAASGDIENLGAVASDGTGAWQLNTLEYTTGATGPEIGHSIGLSFWGGGGNANVFFEDASLTATADGPLPVTPESVTPTEGDFVSGGIAELAESDDDDYSMRRRSSDLQSRTEFEVKSTSPTETPTSLEFTLEGSVFARGNVVQTIELFDYDLGVWELVDTSDSNRAPMPDKVVTATPTGDLSRFVEAGTMCIQARILYKSDRARQKFASNTDQAIWTIGQ